MLTVLVKVPHVGIPGSVRRYTLVKQFELGERPREGELLPDSIGQGIALTVKTVGVSDDTVLLHVETEPLGDSDWHELRSPDRGWADNVYRTDGINEWFS